MCVILNGVGTQLMRKGLHLITTSTPNGKKVQIMLEELKEVYGTQCMFCSVMKNWGGAENGRYAYINLAAYQRSEERLVFAIES